MRQPPRAFLRSSVPFLLLNSMLRTIPDAPHPSACDGRGALARSNQGRVAWSTRALNQGGSLVAQPGWVLGGYFCQDRQFMLNCDPKPNQGRVAHPCKIQPGWVAWSLLQPGRSTRVGPWWLFLPGPAIYAQLRSVAFEVRAGIVDWDLQPIRPLLPPPPGLCP